MNELCRTQLLYESSLSRISKWGMYNRHPSPGWGHLAPAPPAMVPRPGWAQLLPFHSTTCSSSRIPVPKKQLNSLNKWSKHTELIISCKEQAQESTLAYHHPEIWPTSPACHWQAFFFSCLTCRAIPSKAISLNQQQYQANFELEKLRNWNPTWQKRRAKNLHASYSLPQVLDLMQHAHMCYKSCFQHNINISCFDSIQVALSMLQHSSVHSLPSDFRGDEPALCKSTQRTTPTKWIMCTWLNKAVKLFEFSFSSLIISNLQKEWKR